MSEMVERVAKAIHEAIRRDRASFGYVGDADGLTSVVVDDHVNLLAAARAAIEAMREPTKEMVEAGYEAIHRAVDYYNYDSDSGYTVDATGGADVLRAMIDAALQD